LIEQKVIGREARAAYRRLVLAWGERAPGPVRLWIPPAPAGLVARQGWEFHRLGIEARRASFIRAVAARATRLEEAAEMPLEQAYRRLRALPGVGAWSAAEIAVVGLGDADAVSVGDYHLPHTVGWALAREARATDERMLELLEPSRGHRGRVIRLLEAAGIGAPRFGPRSPLRDLARH
jgi:3-methyladenine DNA glycosylase/8-oxoguanine DNA glycosylase